eukprot:CAMPEP_0180017002 /NCGR_PEP_ID=MMETSP0984-20121128/19652_1 /TAXON_ID=483367 /ORGANISM="non described non described, Strain CCMP 2436" /LENGTH=300 /DNA_ID=CAMNT_0021940063 /DNA_START=8 /DNA_END=910 /DNA_ORIENTATION=+
MPATTREVELELRSDPLIMPATTREVELELRSDPLIMPATTRATLLLALLASSARGFAPSRPAGRRQATATCRRSHNRMLEEKPRPLYCVNVKLCVTPAARDTFLTCIRENQAGTLRTEPLAVKYLVGEDAHTPNTFHFLEQYMGEAGFAAHTESAHFKAWEVFAATEPFTAPPMVAFYEEDLIGPCAWAVADVNPGQALYCRSAALAVLPDRRVDFLAAARAAQQGALTFEQACATFIFGEDLNTPNTFHMFEQYMGEDGWLEHVKSESFAAWSTFEATAPFSSLPTAAFYETIEPTKE